MYAFPLARQVSPQERCISTHAETRLQNHGFRLVVARHFHCLHKFKVMRMHAALVWHLHKPSSKTIVIERREREVCTRSFKITELEKGRWSWISNCGEAFHTDSWLAEANPGHSDRDAILQALLPGPSTVVLFGPGKARMWYGREDACWSSYGVARVIIMCRAKPSG